MPDKKLKEQLIREICAVDKSQSYLSWEFLSSALSLPVE